MKAATLILFAAMVVVVSCFPDTLQEHRAEAARKKACMRDCTAVPTKIVCASKPGERGKSFGSTCAMSNHNCDHMDTLQVVSQGPCFPNDAIRLS